MKESFDKLLDVDELTEDQMDHFKMTAIYQAINTTYYPLSEKEMLKSLKETIIVQILCHDMPEAKKDIGPMLASYEILANMTYSNHPAIIQYRHLMKQPLTTVYNDWVEKIKPDLYQPKV